jgi:hypothetical protein
MESSKEYSNFITPPDFVDEVKHTVVMVNATEGDIQALGMFCKTAVAYFNIYFYNHAMNNPAWFDQVLTRADAVVINYLVDIPAADQKRLFSSNKTWYYGPSEVVGSAHHVDTPLDYFINYVENR